MLSFVTTDSLIAQTTLAALSVMIVCVFSSGISQVFSELLRNRLMLFPVWNSEKCLTCEMTSKFILTSQKSISKTVNSKIT